MIYKGGIFNKVVHAEYKEKFKLENQISFVFLGSKDDVRLVGSVDTQKKGRYNVKIRCHNKVQSLTVEVSDTKSPALKVSNYKTDKFEKVTVSNFEPKVKDADPANKSGTFKIKITAKDSSGNYSEMARDVIVSASIGADRKRDSSHQVCWRIEQYR